MKRIKAGMPLPEVMKIINRRNTISLAFSVFALIVAIAVWVFS